MSPDGLGSGRPSLDGRDGNRRTRVVAGVTVAVMVLLLGGGYLLLSAANPTADEWQCAQGEAPATTSGNTRACFPEGSTLPEGFTWDPFGNRPLPSSCDKDGWVLVDGPEGVRDCVREDQPLPSGWSRID